jgi:hypothetical protein
MLVRSGAAVLTAAVLLAGPARADDVTTACGRAAALETRLAPREPGPAKLKAVHCVRWPSSSTGSTAPEVSPDGRWVAIHQYRAGLHVAPLGPGPLVTYPVDPSDLRLSYWTKPAIAWSSRSDFLWTAVQDVALPSHFALGPLQPVRLASGNLQPLPPATNSGGWLQGLLWAGGDGLALATFGVHGRYRSDRMAMEPTLAFIDAARGRVLQTVRFRDIDLLKSVADDDAAYAVVSEAAAVVTPDGKAEAVLRLRRRDWLVWKQDSAPRPVSIPVAPGDPVGIALSPDGHRLLVSVNLQPNGIICEHNPNCPEPTPVTGTVLALYDLAAGRVLWQVQRTVDAWGSSPPPAISPDGRYALAVLRQAEERYPVVSVISMKDGRVLQSFRLWQAGGSLGFAARGRIAWTGAANVVALYDFGS